MKNINVKVESNAKLVTLVKATQGKEKHAKLFNEVVEEMKSRIDAEEPGTARRRDCELWFEKYI